jgi:serine/threonine protein kinase
VVKKFTNLYELLVHEVEILKAIASVPNVIKLEAEVTSDPMAILLSPVGVHFVGTSAIGDTNTVFRMYFVFCGVFFFFVANIYIRSHFECLIRTLDEVHRLGIVHRDIKPSNFFQYKTEPNKVSILVMY